MQRKTRMETVSCRERRLVALVGFVGIFSLTVLSPATALVVGDSVAEFSGTQGQDGWSYGYYDRHNDGDGTYEHATHYSYDFHGNVKTLIQDNQLLSINNPGFADQRFKRIDYEFDLVSGNVNKVMYQKDNPDQYHHAYCYDADNRTIHVHTSDNGSVSNPRINGSAVWNKDAKYLKR